MPEELLGWLKHARGRSEFVIAVVIDIRGFSAFSKTHESPELAMFIKRFYTRAVSNFFPTANFAKPTGDGLLLTFKYEEDDLGEVSKAVVSACLEILKKFPTICDGDPMVNFPTPKNLGIGIARGPACCMHSGGRIIDYSGHLLNLASRLTDLARPSGIVIDGFFKREVIPAHLQDLFEEREVFISSIAETRSHPVLCLKGEVKLPERSLSPIRHEDLKSERAVYTYGDLKKFSNHYHIGIEHSIRLSDSLKVAVFAKTRLPKDSVTFFTLETSEYIYHGGRHEVSVSMDEVRSYLTPLKLKSSALVLFEITYVPQLNSADQEKQLVDILKILNGESQIQSPHSENQSK